MKYLGPADHLVYEGQVLRRGDTVHASGGALERLKALGHLFEGHDPVAGVAFVDQPVAPTIAMGAHGAAITPAEVLASSSDHIAAQREAALQQQQAAAPETTERSAAVKK